MPARVRPRRSIRGVTVGARSRVRHRRVRGSRRKQHHNTGLFAQLLPAYRPATPEEFIQNKNKTSETARTSLRAEAAVHPCCGSHSSGSRLREYSASRRSAQPVPLKQRRGGGDEQTGDHGGDAGVRSRESRRSLRPHHLLPAASDHHPHRVVGESGSFRFILGKLEMSRHI